MQKGKYRFIHQRTSHVEIEVFDPLKFREDFQAWSQLGDPGDGITQEDFLRSRVLNGVHSKYTRGISITQCREHDHIEAIRTCRHCGCTDDNACRLAKGPCDWHDTLGGCCTNPDCIAKEVADLEKEVQNG